MDFSAGFLLLLLGGAAAGPILHHRDTPSVARPAFKAVPFPLSAVSLPHGSRFRTQLDANTNWLLSLNESRLLCLYTSAANLTCSTSGVPYTCIASAKQPSCEPYPHYSFFGHFLGHYLSATAMAFEATADPAIQKRADRVMATLGQVEASFAAVGEPGLIYPYDVTSFQRLLDEAPTGPGGDGGGNCKPVCVPFYVLHKMFAGLLDQHRRAGSVVALQMATKMGDWVVRTVDGALARNGMPKWQGVLNTEWGGMNEALFDLFDLTGNVGYQATGALFNHFQWSAPLALGQDNLDGSHGNVGGNHANTHLPEIVGTARGYEVTGNTTQLAIVANFFNILTAGENKTWDPTAPGGHTFGTGGSNAAEHWMPAGILAEQLMPWEHYGYYKDLGAKTEESCTQYNALKIARHLFAWSADAKYADYYERGLLNGILGNMNVSGGQTVALEYMLPLGGGNLHKPWASVDATSRFPCCWGTLAEQFAKLGDSIYFRSPNNETVFVNLFEPSTLTWNEIVLTQTSGFPADETATTSIAVTVKGFNNGQSWTIAVRVPHWAAGSAAGNTVTVNGVAVPAAQIVPSEYLLLKRAWKTGDTIHVHFPMVLRFEQISDPRPQFFGFGTIHYGPIALAGITANDVMLLGNRTLDEVVHRNSTTELSFEANVPSECGSPPRTIALFPFNDIHDDHAEVGYTLYWYTQPRNPAHTTPTTANSLLLASATDFTLTGGATILAGASDDDVGDNHDAIEDDEHFHATDRALEDPQHQHIDHTLSLLDYDVRTGSHYGRPGLQLRHGPDVGGNLVIRTGTPKTTSIASLAAPFKGPRVMASVSFSYRYNVGYGSGGTGAQLLFGVLGDPDCPNVNSSTIMWKSALYLIPSYDKCRTCYSDPVQVDINDLRVPATDGIALAFFFANNDHNLQVLLPINISIGWVAEVTL